MRMNKKVWSIFVIFLLLAGCSPSVDTPSMLVSEIQTPTKNDKVPLGGIVKIGGKGFLSSDMLTLCNKQTKEKVPVKLMRDGSGVYFIIPQNEALMGEMEVLLVRGESSQMLCTIYVTNNLSKLYGITISSMYVNASLVDIDSKSGTCKPVVNLGVRGVLSQVMKKDGTLYYTIYTDSGDGILIYKSDIKSGKHELFARSTPFTSIAVIEDNFYTLSYDWDNALLTLTKYDNSGKANQTLSFGTEVVKPLNMESLNMQLVYNSSTNQLLTSYRDNNNGTHLLCVDINKKTLQTGKNSVQGLYSLICRQGEFVALLKNGKQAEAFLINKNTFEPDVKIASIAAHLDTMTVPAYNPLTDELYFTSAGTVSYNFTSEKLTEINKGIDVIAYLVLNKE